MKYKSSTFQVFKFLKYKNHTICLYGSTCVSVNMICHKEKNYTKILSLNSVPRLMMDSH